jgi:soluble cytochrome b562
MLRHIDLQLFAEGDPAPAATPSPAAQEAAPTPVPAPAPEPGISVSDQIRAIFDRDFGNVPPSPSPTPTPAPGPAPAPAPQPIVPQPTDKPVDTQPQPSNPEPPAPPAQPQKIFGRFDSMPEAEKSYINMQGAYTKSQQALADANKVIEQLKAEKAALNTPQPGPQQPQKPPEDEFAGLDNEALQAKFYEDAPGFIKKIEDRALARAEKVFNEKLAGIESKVNPVVERVETQATQEKWDNAVRDFHKNNPDMIEFKEGMKQYIQENNLLSSANPEKVLNDAYIHAKGLAYKPQQTIDPKTLLSDEKFVQENVLNNPAIKDKIVKLYLDEIKNANSSVPPSLNPGGTPPMSPPAQANSVREATNLAASRIFG